MPRKDDARDKKPNKLIVPILIFAFLGGIAGVMFITPNSPSAEDILASRQDSSSGNALAEDEFATSLAGGTYKFKDLEAVVAPLKSFMLAGDSFDAKVVLSGINPSANPKLKFAEDQSGARVWTENGVIRMRISAWQEGNHEVKGTVEYEGETFAFATTYTVQRPSLQITATKQNVLYKGVDNPVSIYAPGIPADKLHPSISNGTISKVPDQRMYVVRVTSGSKAVISVMADIHDGSTVSMGQVPFRVKSVPDPKPYFAGKGYQDKKVKKSYLTAAQGVAARMENFDFDLKFTVTSFTLDLVTDGSTISRNAKSNRITSEMKTMLKHTKVGSKVIIRNIRAKGPDGTVRQLGALYFEVV